MKNPKPIRDLETNELISETWRDVEGYEDCYKVSNRGRIKSVTKRVLKSNNRHQTFKGTILSPALNKSGHMFVMLSKNGESKKHYVHRLVAKAFLGAPVGEGLYVLHKDDDPANNDISNLYYGTQKDNMRDCIDNGNMLVGEQRSNSVLDKCSVRKIRQAYKYGGVNQYEIAEQFGITQSHVSQIVNNKIWTHV